MTIKLPSQGVRDFFSNSRFVINKDNDMMPILKYLKVEIEFGICTITKSNLSSFCSHSFQ